MDSEGEGETYQLHTIQDGCLGKRTQVVCVYLGNATGMEHVVTTMVASEGFEWPDESDAFDPRQ